MEIIIFCFGDGLSYIQCNFFAMYKSSHVYNLPATYHHLAHYYLRSLLVSGVFYKLQFPNLFLNGIDPEMNRHSIFFRLASKVLDNARHFTWVNSSKKDDMLSQVEKQNYEVEFKKTVNYLSELFSWSYCFLIQKVLLASKKRTRKLHLITLQNFVATLYMLIRPEWINQSNGSTGGPLGFVIGRLNTSALLYRITPCLTAEVWMT